MSDKTTTRQALERLRRWMIAKSVYNEYEVTINTPFFGIVNEGTPEEYDVVRNVCSSCIGFPLRRLSEKVNKRFLNVELRYIMERNTEGGFVTSVDDIIDEAADLDYLISSGKQLGLSLAPHRDAEEGLDMQYEDVYVVNFQYLLTL